MSKLIQYQLKPFNTWIAIVFADSVKEGFEYLENECKAKIDYSDKDSLAYAVVGHGLDSDGLNSWYVIFDTKNFNIGILAHECLHALYRISKDKGAWLDDSSEEWYTYAIEDMVNFILSKKDE